MEKPGSKKQLINSARKVIRLLRKGDFVDTKDPICDWAGNTKVQEYKMPICENCPLNIFEVGIGEGCMETYSYKPVSEYMSDVEKEEMIDFYLGFIDVIEKNKLGKKFNKNTNTELSKELKELDKRIENSVYWKEFQFNPIN